MVFPSGGVSSSGGIWVVDIGALKHALERQSRWQHARAQLSWSEKLRMAEVLRSAALALGPKRSRQRRPSIDAVPSE